MLSNIWHFGGNFHNSTNPEIRRNEKSGNTYLGNNQINLYNTTAVI